MASQSPNLTVGKSGKPTVSQSISIRCVLICLALPGCAAQDDTVTPPQSQAPQIVAEPSIAVTGLGARITATINPNGINTDCYFEYGPAAAYGTKLPTKFIQANLSDVVISDTGQNLALDTTYHCRLVATNSAGTTQSSDKDFSVSRTPPTIVSEPSITISGPRVAVLTATVNANFRSTDYLFEYGQSTSYEMRTVSKSIGAGGSGVVVRDTIKGLSWDTTYHCRLVAENPAGRTVGSAQNFVCPSAGWIDFVFPLAAGTTWNYTYSYLWGYLGEYQHEKLGRQTWRSAGTWTANSVKIFVTIIDTTRTRSTRIGQLDTAIQITQIDTSFFILVTPDSLDIQWYHIRPHDSFIPALFRVPRTVERNTNTLTNQLGGGSDYRRAIYVSGKGLTSWEDRSSHNYYWHERLTLESVSP